MSEGELQSVMERLLRLFPTMGSDAERQADVVRNVTSYSYREVSQAIDEYLTQGEKFLNAGQFIAIAYRFHQQGLEKERDEELRRQKVRERADAQRLDGVYASADRFIEELNDADVMAEWEKVKGTYPEPLRSWAETWGVQQVRMNRRFRLHVAQLLRPRTVGNTL